MAFRLSTFAPVGQQSRRGKAPSKYIYRTDDTAATIVGSGYFNDVKSKLDQGDEIEIHFVTFTSATDDTVTAEHGKSKLMVAFKSDDIFHVVETGDDKSLVFTTMTDLSTAGNTDVVSNVAGRITKITTILNGAITAGDAAITFSIGGTTIQGSAITVANAGSAQGDVDTSSPTGDNEVAVGGTIRATTDGGSTGAQNLFIIYEIQESQQNKVYVTSHLTDVSTASQIYVAAPVAGKVTKIMTALNGAITVGDATLASKINGVAITGGGITIANAGSAPGDIDTATPTAANTVAAGDALEMETDGGSTDAAVVTILWEITTT